MAKRETLWPTVQQDLLLKAALESGQIALDAWTAWRDTVDYDSLDGGTLRLAPLLRANLQRLGVDDPLLARMKDAQRLGWYLNAQLMARLKSVLALLTAGGIETILLKGLPLALAYYDDPDLRPIGDLDLMIRHCDWTRATAVLTAAGWRTDEPATDPVQRGVHADAFKDRTKFELDLHHSAFHECLEPEQLAPFWDRSIPLVAGSIASRMFCPADQLLHCLAHGLRANELSSVRWVADAVTILRRQPDLDWRLLFDETRRLRLGLPVATGLDYLAATFPGLVPDAALDQSARYRPTLSERIEWFARKHEHLTGQGSRVGFFFRLHDDKTMLAKLLHVPSFLAEMFGTTSPSDTLRIAHRKAVKAFKGFLR
jgi:hypothetical protein